MNPSPGTDAKVASETTRDELLGKLRERIVGFAASRIQRDAAEDLAQEVLILIHEKYSHVEPFDELLPLALRIVRFKMMGLRRKTVRHGEHTAVPVDELPLADGAADPLMQAERHETATRLKRAVGQLGERCKKLLALKLDGKTFAEIQTILGAASLNTIYTWDFRCRKQLTELMGTDWEQNR
jgi:RNA polymerase sigma-70 factor (ECF subfamily)